MKKTRAIIFILVATMCYYSCNQNKCDKNIEVDFCPPALFFTIIDSEENDLFFCENSVYDPRNVVFVPADGRGYLQYWNSEFGDKCFALDFREGMTSVFYVEFVPNRIDTIKIESHFAGWFENPPGCRDYPIHKSDLFFNDILIISGFGYCYDIYKIELK